MPFVDDGSAPSRHFCGSRRTPTCRPRAHWIVVCLLLTSLCEPAFANQSEGGDGAAERLEFAPPTEAQRAVIVSVLGAAFLEESGAFPANVMIASTDFDADGRSDLVVVQRGVCSNRACGFELLHQGDSGWDHIGTLESHGFPYIEAPDRAGWMRDFIIFDHVTDDCGACTPAVPVRMNWFNSSSAYEQAGIIASAIKVLPSRYEQSWDW